MTKITKKWLAGFIDGDGSFALDQVDGFYRPSLSISQNDPQLLHKIKDYFGCGTVTQKSDKAYHYRCRSAKQFRDFIIPKLKDISFQTSKELEYKIICEEALPLLLGGYSKNNLEHVNFIENCNKKIKTLRTSAYSNPDAPINLDWFLGFFEAEGSFYLAVRKSNEVRVAYKITQKNLPLLNKIKDFLNCGLVQSEGRNRGICKYNVEGHKNMIQHGLALFSNHPFKGKKNLERVKFLKALRIIAKNGHKTEKGLTDLRKLEFEIMMLRI